MTERNKSIRTALLRFSKRLHDGGLARKFAAAEPPLRAELFSADQMERHGKALADTHKLQAAHGPDLLLARLGENEGILLGTYDLLREAVKEKRRITPAGEWLLDNFYLIEEQIRTARRHFPKGYSRELPLLASGPSSGLPRVYDIALEEIAHGDGRVDPESLYRFVAAYQKVADLKLGELWAIPIMLRLALIENLRRVGARVAAGMIDRNNADAWADQMIEVAETDPKSLILVIADMARANPPLVNSFVAELARRLQGHSSALALPLTWIEQRLSESGQTIEQLVQSETQSQAANQVSISNSIGSLRLLGAIDWREFVETMSTVDQKLREDPDGVYGRMDFASRDRYRHVIEKLARQSRLSECEVARKAIQLAHQGDGGDQRTRHVGYYLIDHGLTQLEHAAAVRPSAGDVVRRLGTGSPLLLYLGAVGLLVAIFAGGLLVSAHGAGLADWRLGLMVVPALLGTSQLAVTLVNWLVTLLVVPHPLPRMDFAKGIAAPARTLVVVPTMLSSRQGVAELLEALEVRFLANRDPCLHFGLLTDFRDADSEHLPTDAALLQQATAGIAALNEKYDRATSNQFFLFHRPRRWNVQEGIWMGYERKRGKLGDLNALLRGGGSEAFSQIVGHPAILREVKYVITLDTDTQLPRDAAREFAATMAHPLNQPRYDASRQRVDAGYGILQPRMAVSLPSTNQSRYAQLCGSEPGIDPYTRAVSDVYQDLFAEGSFIGKGIYDVDAFEQSLKERFPENRILSHDLLEGCYARAGLLSDVLLYEDYPARYSADVSRRYRWIRGDWQIASWLLPRVPGVGGERRKNPLSKLSQWKLFDNLRRSLVPAALVALFLLGWAAAPAFLGWTLATLGILFVPSLLTSSLDLVRKQPEVRLGQHLSCVGRATGRQFAQATLSLACLPYEAWFSLDAILRTGARLLFTGRRLLEWNPSGELQREAEHKRRRQAAPGSIGDLRQTTGTMWMSPALATTTALALTALRPEALPAALPILGLWLIAPAITWWISRPLARRPATLAPEQRVFLHQLARKTWAFFETFVTARDNWLPPDNFQEHPVAVVAHRTSPTNMGLALLANLSASDFGYISFGTLLERTNNALLSMLALGRYRGHFYNWYDTLSLAPLSPLYVSSVDSGNLAGHLLTLRPGLLALADQSILPARTFAGLADTMGVLQEVAANNPSAALGSLRRTIESAYDARPASIAAIGQWLDKLTAAGELLAEQLGSNPSDTTSEELIWWTQALCRQCQDAVDELNFLAPWARLPAAPESLAELPGLTSLPTLRQLSRLADTLRGHFENSAGGVRSPAESAWLAELQPLVELASQRASERILTSHNLARQVGELAVLDYDFLYDKLRHLLTVGYNVDQRRQDTGSYDLLASEARLSSFVAIAQGAVPQESWFALGRLLTTAGGDPILLSWSGSMFEYLMPMLVMPTYENTLLHQTCLAAVQRQIAYGKQRGVPWGMSESGYNAVDARLNYQYRAFGVPGLGLKRGLGEDLVIAPYASALALMVMPEAACENLQRLTADGLQGKFGMYEAVDFTPARLPRGQNNAVVRSFMAHHQGMSLLAIAYLLHDQPMQKRFVADPLFQATTLLLQERVPVVAAFHVHAAELSEVRTTSAGPEMPMRIIRSADTPSPEVQLLSNGRYHVMVTNAGGGYSRWKDFAITRWQEDGTSDNWGTFCYLRDVATGACWSTAHQPTGQPADTYEAIFSEARAEFRRLDHDYETHTEIVVSPEDDIELRRIRLTNRSRVRRTIEITSYAEVVLASPAADALHPAFSNLFVQSEIVPEQQAILCTRRPRAVGDPVPWMFHLMAVHGATCEAVSYETDRARFIGRTRSLAAPEALRQAGPLSGSQGSVLDPIVAIRYRISLDPEQSATLDVVSGIADSRDAALGLVGKYRDRNLADRVFEVAWTHSWVNLQQINASESDAQLFNRLAGSVIYVNPLLRAEASVLASNRRGQSGLWGYAISGDLPIVLLQIGDQANIELVRQLVQAHAYWRLKGLAVDLVIWNEDHAGYRQVLQEQIMGLIAAGVEANLTDRPGGIFVRVAEQISSEDRILFQTVARAIISDTRGPLVDQLGRRSALDMREALLPRLIPSRGRKAEGRPAPLLPRDDLLFFNGFGGFTQDGREYVITTAPGQTTPTPWVNVIANSHFGTVISESGAAYTWSENAHEFRFTPWHNDPVSDASGEAIYLRDEESGHFWSPTPLPCPGSTPYVTRHGFGYSIFEHEEDGIRSELTVHIDAVAALKFSVLKISNNSGRARQLSATGYVEWVLGDLRPKSAMHVVTVIDPASGALSAHNPYSAEFADRIAFFDADEATRQANVTLSGDRREFIGRNGSLRKPAAMGRAKLSNKIGAGLDPCGAIQVPFELADGEQREIIFRLGTTGRRGSDADELKRRLRGSEAARNSLEAVRDYWRTTLGAVQVDTPDPALNVLANGWLLYQTIACRLWARSGYYQSGGAFGFRDQLQDTMALVHARPALLREQLLRSAARQFVEGDVQHWWHPPVGRGVRTHCSDDYLWLPQAVCRYVESTGDRGILGETVTFLEGRPVNPEDDSYYDLPLRSETSATLYQHCLRAIVHGLSFGTHGLPLIGSGDWNDGMNLVGMQGKGESVWLGFFLYDTLLRFADLARDNDDAPFAERCHGEAEQLRHNIEAHGWDGEWYRRAYFDDGTPLGSASNPECRIDSIAQSWSVLSGAGETLRARTAMAALDQHLVRRDGALIQLLDPPFDRSELNPGYIKGYVPGIRENGGQYTHGAIWAAMAFARQGDHQRAWELFDMINPVRHGDSPAAIAIYKVEPYVAAADVYAVAPHTGRGGWTWYTGSAGWLYRLILESLLGVQLAADKLRFVPCLPQHWPGFTLRYRYRETLYVISVVQTAGADQSLTVSVDGSRQADPEITLVDDRQEHVVEVRIPAAL
ncbi:GH36-type glycosyl hydrolase domain-containing protein [Dechloromonas denitrificans]|uniref:GH36-type glycosyl hydrolase domain-containing protein n=1 Tax=Dechloromonas denitrificans TaxID=281362 RepID=UPI00299E430F|nr:glucoamylase family protein [Dechloromonas denitrificans]